MFTQTPDKAYCNRAFRVYRHNENEKTFQRAVLTEIDLYLYLYLFSLNTIHTVQMH